VNVTLPNNFTPRPYQRRYMGYFDAGGKRACWIVHRRGGKDLTAAHQTCKEMHKRRGVYWHIFPTAEQGRKAIWEGFTRDGQRVMEQVFPAAIRKSPRYFAPNAEMLVELKCGAIWRLMGSDKMEVVGAGPVGVVFSEYSLAKPHTWDFVRPMLRENDGWASFIYTPRGKNHGKKLYDMARGDASWFCELLTLQDTRAYDPEATVAEERAAGMPEELIQQEYFCDFTAALVGSFYGVSLSALEARGGLDDFECGQDDVFTSWDLGKADDTAIWWWRLEGEDVDVLDHYASHGEDLPHYFDLLDSRAEKYGWRYRKHWLPHDARAKTLATRVSVLEQFVERYGTERVAIGPQLTLKDGIAAVRRLLNGSTRIHPRCSDIAGPKDCDGLEALRAYHREWDDEAKCFAETPVHDWASHTADAFRYLALEAEASCAMLRKLEDDKPKRPKVAMDSGFVQVDTTDIFEGRRSSAPFKRRRI
jgi:phage terminase large subunit